MLLHHSDLLGHIVKIDIEVGYIDLGRQQSLGAAVTKGV
jgi:hypothetical protein